MHRFSDSRGLILVALAATLTFAFLFLARIVQSGATEALDTQLLLALREPGDRDDPLGPPWLEEIGRDLTALGGVAVLSGITLFALGMLCLHRRGSAALLLLAAVVSGVILSLVLKAGFDRPRPDLVPRESEVYTKSFPSGHSMLSAVTYLTLGIILMRMHERHLIRVYLLLAVMTVTCLVGVSRIYLGVHWPSDVVAGWSAGAAWSILWWFIARDLQRRGAVEQPSDDSVVGDTAAE